MKLEIPPTHLVLNKVNDKTVYVNGNRKIKAT